MNYLSCMKNLKQFEETRIALRQNLSRTINIVQGVKNMVGTGNGANETNIVNTARYLIRSRGNDMSGHLSEDIEDGCQALGIEFSEDLRKKTAAYEQKIAQIGRDAAEEIERGRNKPLSQSAGKIMGLLWSGCTAFVFLVIYPIAIKPMIEGPLFEDSFSFMPMLGVGSLLIFLALLAHKKKPNLQRLSALANDMKRLTRDYVNYVYPPLDAALSHAQAECESQIEALTEAIKADIGETVFELYENVPFGQRKYFLDLGMTATCEADFNDIVKECIKAEKTDQQIALQQHLNNEARNELNKSLNKLNQTARQIQEDARTHASQMAEQNRHLAAQNDRNLRNQSKTLDELKKQTKLSADLEFQLRQVKDKVDD